MYSLGAVPSAIDVRDYIFPKNRSRSPLPPTLDLRKTLLKIRNQGKYGTCVAQSGACCKEYQERREINFNQYLSPQFIYNWRGNYPNPGMSGRDLMKILTKHGVAQEAHFVYGDNTRPDAMSKVVLSDAQNFKIKSYATIRYTAGLSNYLDNINYVKQSLVDNGPCVLFVPSYNYDDMMWIKGINDKFLGYHAMCIVGYNAGGFIIRNSWGASWGDDGYCEMSYGDYNKRLWAECWTMVDDVSNAIVPIQPKCGCALV